MKTTKITPFFLRKLGFWNDGYNNKNFIKRGVEYAIHIYLDNKNNQNNQIVVFKLFDDSKDMNKENTNELFPKNCITRQDVIDLIRIFNINL